MATLRQRIAFDKVVENGGNVSRAMIDIGYSPATAKTPQKLTESVGWKELVNEHMSDGELMVKHKQLLNSTKIEHMTFPLGPKKTETQDAVIKKLPKNLSTILDAEIALSQTSLSDDDIKQMLAEVNCKVRQIVHGETARHVYYWAPDTKALKDALDMAYKLKGSYAAEKSVSLNLSADMNQSTEGLLELKEEYEAKLKAKLLAP